MTRWNVKKSNPNKPKLQDTPGVFFHLHRTSTPFQPVVGSLNGWNRRPPPTRLLSEIVGVAQVDVDFDLVEAFGHLGLK